MKKVIIAGSRNFSNYNLLKKTLDNLFTESFILISGGAKGADLLGEKYAKERNYEIEQHLPDWKNISVPNCVVKYNQYGPYNALAGYNRNQEMLNSILNNIDGGCVVVFWDGKSRGTEDMIKVSEKQGINVHKILY